VLQTVKDYLKITWADEDTTIRGIIGRGQAYLNGLAGVELDYAVCVTDDEQYAADLRGILGQLTAEPAEGEDPMTIDEAIAQILAAEARRDSCTAKPSLAVSLLLDYCRYAYNNALEYFEENFRAQILRLQLLEGVKALADEVAP
jgi:hypothetical protein